MKLNRVTSAKTVESGAGQLPCSPNRSRVLANYCTKSISSLGNLKHRTGGMSVRAFDIGFGEGVGLLDLVDQ